MRIDCTSKSLTEIDLDDMVFAIDSRYWNGGDCELIVALNVVALGSNWDRKPELQKQFKAYTGESMYVPKSTANPAYYAAMTFDNLSKITAVIVNKPLFDVTRSLERFLYNPKFFQTNTFYCLPIQHRKVVYAVESGKFWDYSFKHSLIQYSEQAVKENLMYHEYLFYKKHHKFWEVS